MELPWCSPLLALCPSLYPESALLHCGLPEFLQLERGWDPRPVPIAYAQLQVAVNLCDPSSGRWVNSLCHPDASPTGHGTGRFVFTWGRLASSPSQLFSATGPFPSQMWAARGSTASHFTKKEVCWASKEEDGSELGCRAGTSLLAFVHSFPRHTLRVPVKRWRLKLSSTTKNCGISAANLTSLSHCSFNCEMSVLGIGCQI